MKHTPGPWRINPRASTAVEDATGKTVAACGSFGGTITEEHQCNARLIAAAPETAAERDDLRAALGRTNEDFRVYKDERDQEIGREKALNAKMLEVLKELQKWPYSVPVENHQEFLEWEGKVRTLIEKAGKE